MMDWAPLKHCCMCSWGVQSMKSRVLGQKLSFLQHVLEGGSEIISESVLKAMCERVSELCLVKECKELEDLCRVVCTEKILI